ncbi:hypothetical protein BC827DRAFT_1156051 [Russula dissimulans]|nr:hypothetical protein BC827DRAFT_1156051 [Russula dissimulans]
MANLPLRCSRSWTHDDKLTDFEFPADCSTPDSRLRKNPYTRDWHAPYGLDWASLRDEIVKGAKHKAASSAVPTHSVIGPGTRQSVQHRLSNLPHFPHIDRVPDAIPSSSVRARRPSHPWGTSISALSWKSIQVELMSEKRKICVWEEVLWEDTAVVESQAEGDNPISSFEQDSMRGICTPWTGFVKAMPERSRTKPENFLHHMPMMRMSVPAQRIVITTTPRGPIAGIHQLKHPSEAHEANQGTNRPQISLNLEGFTNTSLHHSKDFW